MACPKRKGPAYRLRFAMRLVAKSMFTTCGDRGMCEMAGFAKSCGCLIDGEPDRWHSEHWNQLVEDFFPLEVSQLFFFDAEKIRSLAEDETSSQVLGSAVKSLLGLDIAERLIGDAAVVETNLRKKLESRGLKRRPCRPRG